MLELFINQVAKHRKLNRSTEFYVFIRTSAKGLQAASMLAPPIAPRAETSYISALYEGAQAYFRSAEPQPPQIHSEVEYAAMETRVMRFRTKLGEMEKSVQSLHK